MASADLPDHQQPAIQSLAWLEAQLNPHTVQPTHPAISRYQPLLGLPLATEDVFEAVGGHFVVCPEHSELAVVMQSGKPDVWRAVAFTLESRTADGVGRQVPQGSGYRAARSSRRVLPRFNGAGLRLGPRRNPKPGEWILIRRRNAALL